MKILYVPDNYDSRIPSAVTVGKFDGFHLGHLSLLESVASKKERGLEPVVITIEKSFEAPGILSVREQKELLGSLDVEVWMRLKLSDIRDLEPETFVREVLSEKLNAGYVVSGSDFRFGKNQAGGPELLRSLGKKYGFDTEVIPEVHMDGRIIDSTSIRSFLSHGDLSSANQMLGHPYSIGGNIVHGRSLGRKLGFSTMNVSVEEDKLLPGFGVYFGRVNVEDESMDCLIFIGLKETVSTALKPVVEVHVPGLQRMTYGEYAVVYPERFMRPEIRFESVEELKIAMENDLRIFHRMKNEKTS